MTLSMVPECSFQSSWDPEWSEQFMTAFSGPLKRFGNISGIFIKRGISVPSLDKEKKWHFVPSAKEGDAVSGGMVLGTVQETENVLHKILVPPHNNGVLVSIVPEGDYTVEEVIAVLEKETRKRKISSSCTGGRYENNVPRKGVFRSIFRLLPASVLSTHFSQLPKAEPSVFLVDSVPEKL